MLSFRRFARSFISIFVCNGKRLTDVVYCESYKFIRISKPRIWKKKNEKVKKKSNNNFVME